MLIDYVGFALTQRRMREQFAYEPECVAPPRKRRTQHLSPATVRHTLAMLLRLAAERLEPARRSPLATDGCEAW